VGFACSGPRIEDHLGQPKKAAKTDAEIRQIVITESIASYGEVAPARMMPTACRRCGAVLKYVLEGTDDRFPGQPPHMLGAPESQRHPLCASRHHPAVHGYRRLGKPSSAEKNGGTVITTGLFFLDSSSCLHRKVICVDS